MAQPTQAVVSLGQPKQTTMLVNEKYRPPPQTELRRLCCTSGSPDPWEGLPHTGLWESCMGQEVACRLQSWELLDGACTTWLTTPPRKGKERMFWWAEDHHRCLGLLPHL